jgi:hypothetical protein
VRHPPKLRVREARRRVVYRHPSDRLGLNAPASAQVSHAGEEKEGVVIDTPRQPWV